MIDNSLGNTRQGFNASKGFDEVPPQAQQRTNGQQSPFNQTSTSQAGVTSQNTANLKGKLAALDVSITQSNIHC